MSVRQKSTELSIIAPHRLQSAVAFWIAADSCSILAFASLIARCFSTVVSSQNCLYAANCTYAAGSRKCSPRVTLCTYPRCTSS